MPLGQKPVPIWDASPHRQIRLLNHDAGPGEQLFQSANVTPLDSLWVEFKYRQLWKETTHMTSNSKSELLSWPVVLNPPWTHSTCWCKSSHWDDIIKWLSFWECICHSPTQPLGTWLTFWTRVKFGRAHATGVEGLAFAEIVFPLTKSGDFRNIPCTS